MKATDKGLHDPVRTEAEARADAVVKSVARIKASLARRFGRTDMVYAMSADLRRIIDHIDTQAARIKELEESVRSLHAQLNMKY